MRRALGLGTSFLLAMLAGENARAQQASYGQYLVVLDDSGSMDQSDPERLVVLAALALGAALEDGDQAMLVGLNELASGEAAGPAFVSPRELLPGRDGAEGPRPLRSDRVERLGRHQGQTPCRDALARARTILESVASSGAPQTLLLLTDGACTGGLEPADAFLGGLRAHREGRFRFVPLMRAGRGRPDRQLAEYAQRTGFPEASQVAFDARSLTRAFADVLSFSRGLRYDEGGRVGLERTFAGARTVRILAIQPEGVDRIALERVESSGGGARALAGGPTFRHPEHGWSLRVATDAASDTPYAVRSPTPGTEVLVIPVYGRLRVEGVIAPCGEPPPLPWDAERAVRAGQPACAWARLVGDRGETIHPTRSFAFQVDLCTGEACDDATAMQPSDDGIFNAQLGAEIPTGRHERAFRAHGGALAAPVVQRRGFSAMAFGVHRVATAAEPDRSIDAVELGAIPKPTADDVSLVLSGAFPAGTRARVACEVDADEAIRACVSCELADGEVELQDPFRVQATVRASHFCQPVSDGSGELPVRLRIAITPSSDEVSAHSVPIQATLTYAETPTIELALEGGERLETNARIPAPIAQAEIQARAEDLDTDELEAHTHGTARLAADPDRTAELPLVVRAGDCCGVGEHRGILVLTPAGGGPSLRVPLVIDVRDPGWWTCPGKQIAMWVAIALGVLFLIWLVHGFVSPEKFGEGAVLMWASSHDQLLGLRDGDEGWRRLQRFPETKRGFRRPAALWLGGPRAPLPSLKRMPADACIEASPGGGGRLIVKADGLEKFEESTGWTEVPKGTHPVSNRITLRRGDELYLQFRR